MKQFLHHPNLTISEADHKKVDHHWAKQTFPYPHNRLYYVTEGEAKIVLTDRCIYLRTGYLYLLPAFMMVETICDVSFTHYYVHFHIDALDFTTYLTYDMPNFYVQCEEPDLVQALFHRLTQDVSASDFGHMLSNQGAIQLLLAPFFPVITTHQNKDTQRFQPAIEYIDHHLHENISIQTLAHLLSLEKVYFSNLFTKAFSIPPRQYINKCRLNKAQLLLINSQKSVKEIALEVGFENASYFSRLFHCKIGMTPGTYRDSI